MLKNRKRQVYIVENSEKHEQSYSETITYNKLGSGRKEEWENQSFHLTM